MKIAIQSIVMQYHRESENANTMENIDVPAGQPLLSSDDSEIKQIRQFILILISICLVNLIYEKIIPKRTLLFDFKIYVYSFNT